MPPKTRTSSADPAPDLDARRNEVNDIHARLHDAITAGAGPAEVAQLHREHAAAVIAYKEGERAAVNARVEAHRATAGTKAERRAQLAATAAETDRAISEFEQTDRALSANLETARDSTLPVIHSGTLDNLERIALNPLATVDRAEIARQIAEAKRPTMFSAVYGPAKDCLCVWSGLDGRLGVFAILNYGEPGGYAKENPEFNLYEIRPTSVETSVFQKLCREDFPEGLESGRGLSGAKRMAWQSDAIRLARDRGRALVEGVPSAPAKASAA